MRQWRRRGRRQRFETFSHRHLTPQLVAACSGLFLPMPIYSQRELLEISFLGNFRKPQICLAITQQLHEPQPQPPFVFLSAAVTSTPARTPTSASRHRAPSRSGPAPRRVPANRCKSARGQIHTFSGKGWRSRPH